MDQHGPQFGILDLLEVDPAQTTGQSLADHCALLRAGDRLGLDYLFVAERHFVPDQRAARRNSPSPAVCTSGRRRSERAPT